MSRGLESPQESCGLISSSSAAGSVLSFDFTKQKFSDNQRAFLVMVVPPESHFRYRYDTEMSGAHGSLQADRGSREKQIPTVQLVAYSGPAVIRVSLATCNDGPRYPHPHHLFVREKLYLRRYKNLDGKELYKTGHFIDPHYIVVHESDYTAKFEGMCIISSKKEHFQRVIKGKLQQRGHHDTPQLEQIVQEALRHVDIAFVSLCFEAFSFENGVIGEAICSPLYSDPIANAKNASSGKLKITRINKCTGSCQGGDSIWLLVEKINKKGLVVRFFEQAPDGTILWESVVEGDKLELHYQYAVIFNTPPYRDQDIVRDVPVSMRLERRVVPFDYSDPETFVYEPCKQRLTRNDNIYRKESMFTIGVPSKRPITDLIPPYMVPNKRRTEDFITSDPYDTYRFNQQWDKEFESILMDLFQLDGVVEMDGPVDHRQRVLLKVVQALVARSQLKDKDIKAVTEKIGRLFLQTDDLKLQDAASTLLSLRSGGLSMKPVHDAVLSGELSSVEAVLQSGGDACELNDEGRTPLHVAVDRGYIPLVELLLKQKSAPVSLTVKDKNGLTALHVAVMKTNMAAIKAIMAAGGDANLTDATGQSSIDIALHNGNEEIIRLVMEKQRGDVSPANLSKSSKPKTTIEKLAEVLNRSGKWENLASLWDLSSVGKEAAKTQDPTMHVFSYIEQKHGLDLEALRNLLDAIEEKEGVAIIDESLAKRFM